MADGTTLNPMQSGDTIDTEDFGARGKAQRIKMVVGDLDVDGGDVATDNPLPTNPGHIAGEDATNDRMKTSNEVVQSNTNVFHAVSFTSAQEQQSAQINCSNYRKYFIGAWGSLGNCKVLLQVSFDGGSTWLWHPNGQSADSQFPAQQGDLSGAPLCRVDIVNDAGSTQNIEAYLGLAR